MLVSLCRTHSLQASEARGHYDQDTSLARHATIALVYDVEFSGRALVFSIGTPACVHVERSCCMSISSISRQNDRSMSCQNDRPRYPFSAYTPRPVGDVGVSPQVGDG